MLPQPVQDSSLGSRFRLQNHSIVERTLKFSLRLVIWSRSPVVVTVLPLGCSAVCTFWDTNRNYFFELLDNWNRVQALPEIGVILRHEYARQSNANRTLKNGFPMLQRNVWDLEKILFFGSLHK